MQVRFPGHPEMQDRRVYTRGNAGVFFALQGRLAIGREIARLRAENSPLILAFAMFAAR